MKDYLPLGCWIIISFGDGLYLWLLGVIFYINLFGIETTDNSSGVNWIPRDFTRNIQYFGPSLICVVCDISNTGTRDLKLATKWKTTYLLGCWISISSGDVLHLWLWGALVYLTLFGIFTAENSWGVNWILIDFTRNIKFLWFEFNQCGLIHWQDATDPKLDNNTGSERIFQR